ncbi:MAG: radical SAM protein [Desulfomonile sp.]|nr:radical SAM protein [Desulfomonile sp.]
MTFLFINVNHDVGYESSESTPISLGYIVAALEAEGYRGVILDDLKDRPLSFKSLEKWILRLDPSVIGFTVYQSTIHRVRLIARYLKSRHRKIHVVLGGPQIIAMPSEALKELEDVDALVRSDGEIVMPAMARALAAGESLESVPGITCRCGGGILDTDPGLETPLDLDAYPSPYLTDLLNLEGKETAILLSSRGCSHACWFCITPHICKGRVRFHSVARIVDEMESLAARGIQRFWFADPNFTEDRARTEALLQEKMHRGIATPFWFQTRTDLIDPALLEKLQAAGADTVAFGLESGSPGVLARTNKRILLEQIRENVAAAQALGMETELFTIFGLPGETVDDARETLEFVRSLGIPVHSNSGSQQMQLYFGSVYAKNPERFGFKALPGYRPSYLSVGDEYETESMTRSDIKKVRDMWTLANEQMEQDVYYKQRLFEVLDFLLENRAGLMHEPALYAFGALASCAIEEFDLLVDFLEGYSRLPGVDQADVAELVSSLNFFRETDEPTGPTDRVIFDSRSFMDGVSFTGISGKYWDVLLGRGLLLESFERAFVGSRSGNELSFEFTFPEDYYEEDLRGRTVEVHAKVRKVFTRVEASSLEQVRSLAIRNRYDFPDLDLLKDHNEILYYLSLRDADPVALARTPSHFLRLAHKLAKLGKKRSIDRLASVLDGRNEALGALADTLAAAGKFRWALEYYNRLPDGGQAMALKRARCLIAVDEAASALQVLESLSEGNGLEFQQVMLECLKKALPESNRIPSLEHHVLDLRVAAALERETMPLPGAPSARPVVHGVPDR